MLICDKIKQTMPPSIHRLISLARANDWEDFKGLWVPEDFRIEGCRVLAGMRSTCTLIEDDGLWFEGSDGSQLFVSVRLGKEWLGRELGRASAKRGSSEIAPHEFPETKKHLH